MSERRIRFAATGRFFIAVLLFWSMLPAAKGEASPCFVGDAYRAGWTLNQEMIDAAPAYGADVRSPPNYEAAARYYLLGLNRSQDSCRRGLARLYIWGLGVPKDYPKALALLERDLEELKGIPYKTFKNLYDVWYAPLDGYDEAARMAFALIADGRAGKADLALAEKLAPYSFPPHPTVRNFVITKPAERDWEWQQSFFFGIMYMTTTGRFVSMGADRPVRITAAMKQAGVEAASEYGSIEYTSCLPSLCADVYAAMRAVEQREYLDRTR